MPKIVHVAADLVDCEAGGLFVNHGHLQELELVATYGLTDSLAGDITAHAEGLIGLVTQTGLPQVNNDYAIWPYRDSILKPYQFKTMIGVPLKQVGEVEAVLFVGNRTNQRLFNQADLDILARFAAQAAIALRTSQLINREERLFKNLNILHKISNYIQTTRT